MPPPNCVKGNEEQCIPVNPTPTFIAAWQRIALTTNPAKYHTSALAANYAFWLETALETESLTPIHHPAYYSNNLFAESWYLIAKAERCSSTFKRDGGGGAAAAVGGGGGGGGGAREGVRSGSGVNWPKVSARLTTFLSHYASNLQANLNAYYFAAAGGYNTTAAATTITNTNTNTNADANANSTTGNDANSTTVDGTVGGRREKDPELELWNAITEATLWDHPAASLVEHRVDNNNRSGIYGATVSCSESCNCSTTAILVRDRPFNEYVWQIDPTKLSGGDDKPATQPTTAFGGAFLAPYWVWQSATLGC